MKTTLLTILLWIQASVAAGSTVVWNFAPKSNASYEATAEYKALRSKGAVHVISIKEGGDKGAKELKAQMKALCLKDRSLCKSDIVLTGHSSGDAFWGDRNNNRIDVVAAKQVMDELKKEGVTYTPSRVLMIGCYSGAAGYLAVGKDSGGVADEFTGKKPGKEQYIAWTDVFAGEPTYFGFSYKGPDRNSILTAQYIDTAYRLSDEISKEARKVIAATDKIKPEKAQYGEACKNVPPLKKSELEAPNKDAFAKLLENFSAVAKRNPTICQKADGKTVFADKTGTIVVDRKKEDPRCKGYIRRLWCTDYIQTLKTSYTCFNDPTVAACSDRKFTSPPPETDENEIRQFYNYLQASSHCEDEFKAAKMENFPVPLHVLSLIKFRSVVNGYMNDLRADASSKALYQELEKAGLRNMSRKQLVEYLKKKQSTDPAFTDPYYALVTFGRVQLSWFD